MNKRSLRLVSIALGLLVLVALAPAGAQDARPVADLVLVDALQADDGSVHARVRIAGCGGAQSWTSTVSLMADGVVVAEGEVDVDIVEGDKCANTSNGQCDGIKCPDAIINGVRRKGTCTDGSVVLCVCDYGVVGIDLDDVDVTTENLTVWVDSGHAVGELSEVNNVAAVGRRGASGGPGGVIALHDEALFEELGRRGTLARPPAGVSISERYVEVQGDTAYLVQRGWDEAGNCHAIAQATTADGGASLEIEHSCTGAPCSSCSFVRNRADEITGCKCNDTPASNICNHSIGEVDGVQPVGFEVQRDH